MTLKTPSAFKELLGLAASQSHFFWLVQVTSPDDSGILDIDGSTRVLRLNDNGVAVAFDINPASGQPLVWQAWPIKFSDISSTGDGSIEGVSIEFGNVDGYAARLFAQNNRFVDCVVRMRLVHSDLLEDPTAHTTFRLRVTSSRLTYRSVSLQCSSHNFSGISFPIDLITRQCRFCYRGPECGFTPDVYDPGNTLGQCPKTLSACKARGQWAVDNGLAASVATSDWPLRFGGFQALPPSPLNVS